jgi:hypothetical protein
MMEQDMPDNIYFDAAVWTAKARAFVTRSHRHLWGKNNEDPQVFLFKRGLKNQFIKKMMLGWNKFGQVRPIQNWGFQRASQAEKKISLFSGIVVPFIVEKKLTSVFIHPYNKDDLGNKDKTFRTTLLQGSSSPTMVIGNNREKIAVVQDMFDGLYLYQETLEAFCVLIHPNPGLGLTDQCQSILKTAGRVCVFSSDNTNDDLNRKVFPHALNPCFYTYESKEELKALFLMH